MFTDATYIVEQKSAQRLGVWGELLKLICQPFTHNVSFMKASCDDLILLGAAQKQYGADENKPEHPADPFTTPRPDKGIRRPVSGRSDALRGR